MNTTSRARVGALELCLSLMLILASGCGEDEGNGEVRPSETSGQIDAGNEAPDMQTADMETEAEICEANEHVDQGTCEPCAPGSTRPAGDDTSGPDTTCEPTLCGEDERVQANTCVSCSPGSTNMAGDDATGAGTTCDGVLCPSNQRVEQNACVPCPAGTTRPAGDDASGPDTTCEATLCGEDERVQANTCVSCPAGSSNTAGDDASGPDTTCEANLCAEDERVEANTCVSCSPGTTNAPGDDPSGPDTMCQDACLSAFGVPCSQVAYSYLKASNSGAGDQFNAVSISGDRLAVGAKEEGSCADGVDPPGAQNDDTCPEAGAVYIFSRDPQTGSWSQEAYLKASNSDESDFFGGSVSLSGDRLAVGAVGEMSCFDGVESNNSCGVAGAVYLFARDPQTGSWSQEAYLKASNSGQGQFFGRSVSLAGDRLAVGASGENSCADGVDPAGGQADNGCRSAGAVYLYSRNLQSGAWSQNAYIKASNSESLDYFGGSVSLSGDRLAVGARGEGSCADGVDPAGGQADNACNAAGAVYLFSRDPQTDSWSQDVYLKASNSEGADLFGWSVSLSGERLAVGAVNEDSCSDGVDPAGGQADNGCNGAGAVYLFSRESQGNSWSQETYLKSSNPDDIDAFGDSLALSGDRLAIGGSIEGSCADGVEPVGGEADNACYAAGAVYLFDRDPQSNSWSQDAYMKASNSDEDDHFGDSVSLSGGLLAVGASAEASCADGVDPVAGESDNSCSEAGAVYTYQLAP